MSVEMQYLAFLSFAFSKVTLSNDNMGPNDAVTKRYAAFC